MAIMHDVYISGERVSKVRRVSFGWGTPADELDGRPSGRTRNRTIFIERDHDADNRFFEWASSSTVDNRKAGKVVFVDSGKEVVNCEWENGWIVDYKLFMHASPRMEQGIQMRESIVISAEIVKINSVENNDNWKL